MWELRYLAKPVGDAPITQGFGVNGHRGVDFGVPVGTPVLAVAEGLVVDFTNDGSFGNGVCLLVHDKLAEWYLLHAHLSQVDVAVGQYVKAGRQLGLSGNTGLSTGPHLHWQQCRTAQFPVDIAQSVDPLSFYHPLTEAEMEEIKQLQEAVGRLTNTCEALMLLACGNGEVDGWGKFKELVEYPNQVNLYKYINDLNGALTRIVEANHLVNPPP